MSTPAPWLEFLQEMHAAPADLPNRPLELPEDACLLCDLSDRGLIRIEGADAQTFLQGQLSNDVRKIDAGHSQLTSYSNPKGRMIATARLFERDSAYWLMLTQTMLEPVLRRLSMFVLRAEVRISNASVELVRFGIAGRDAASLLAQAGIEAPTSIDAVTSKAGVSVIRVACLTPRFELLAPAEVASALWRKLAEQARIAHPDTWALLDIRAGLPTIFPQTSEAFVAQMANFELVDGISFSKGCYTGQEVIARTHYLGKPKRRMYGFSVESASRPVPGTDLISTSAKPPTSAGAVVDARLDQDGRYLGLAVVQKRHLDDTLHLQSAEGALVHLRPLPYPVEDEDLTGEDADAPA